MKRVTRIWLLLIILPPLIGRGQVTSYGQHADTLIFNSYGQYCWAWIHLPGDWYTNPTKKHPLIFFLHGAGQAGSGEIGLDSLIATTMNGTAGAGPAWLINQGDSMNFYNYITHDTDKPIIVSPQFSLYSASGPYVDYMISDLLYWKPGFGSRIDSNRISVTGLSAGGQGTYDEISGYDNNCSCYFGPLHKITSAVIMSAALNASNGEIPAFTHIISDSTYLWGMGDSVNDIHGINTAAVVDDIHNYAGGAASYLSPSYYLFPGAPGHCCWLAEYQPSFTQVINGQSLNVYQFMLSHSLIGLTPAPPDSLHVYRQGNLIRHRGYKLKLN